jgi:hypothetical protein
MRMVRQKEPVVTAIFVERIGIGAARAANSCARGITFDRPELFAWLEAAGEAALDRLSFSPIVVSADAIVKYYNPTGAAFSSLTAERVTGRNFFTSVASVSTTYGRPSVRVRGGA